MSKGVIELRGVRVHNLQNVDVDIPLHKLTVIVGVSGSGKSSLAFDTLYAEGQRRYIESFSTYARQFLDRLRRPDADRIDNLPPAIAVRQGVVNLNARSTVATATEIHDHLRLLFARVGEIICPECGAAVHRATPETVVAAVRSFEDGNRFQIAFIPEVPADDEEEEPADLGEHFREIGFSRAIIEEDEGLKTVDLASRELRISANLRAIVVDRLVAGRSEAGRLLDSIELAFRHGSGTCCLLHGTDDKSARESVWEVDGRRWNVLGFSNRLECESCDRTFAQPEPGLFSFNSAVGACAECEGLGFLNRGDAEQVGNESCLACTGSGLNEDARSVHVGGCDIASLCRQTVGEVHSLLHQLPDRLNGTDLRIAKPILAEIAVRTDYLLRAGLPYVTLDRRMQTLSGGEAQRVALTSALGSSLVNALYVLDEPTAGLHPRDTERIIDCVQSLRDAGNTVVVVEHDEALLEAADYVVEIGPGAGRLGGNVIAQGPPTEILKDADSITVQWKTDRASRGSSSENRRTPNAWIELKGVHRNNLRGIDVRIPLGVLCVVTGVSGSGKSSLVEDTLFPIVAKELEVAAAPEPPGTVGEISGHEALADIVLVDQRPLARNARSNAVTYLKVFDEIRKVFATTPDAKIRNFTAATFSFNSSRGGRCPRCSGHGSVSVDMQFLADIDVECPECNGTRYRPEVLDVKYRGLNIAELLDLTVDEAFTFFRGRSKIQKRLRFLRDVGLGYLPPGQPANTLSGGESQRLKLAAHMAGVVTDRKGKTDSRTTLFLLDEPTNGLHGRDVEALKRCLNTLIDVGNSIVMIEHDLEMINAADYVIDLGPGAGQSGGNIVAMGTPEEIASVEASVTGAMLRERA